jgi:hypothetical protein
MTYPVSEFVLAAGLIVAIGAGAVAVLPPEPAPRATIRLVVPPAKTARAEPKLPPANAERVEALQRQLQDIAAEQKRLTAQVKAALRERKAR